MNRRSVAAASPSGALLDHAKIRWWEHSCAPPTFCKSPVLPIELNLQGRCGDGWRRGRDSNPLGFFTIETDIYPSISPSETASLKRFDRLKTV